MAVKFAQVYPECVCSIVAGAPVTQWKLYDAPYTERYFGRYELYTSTYEYADINRLSDAFIKKFQRFDEAEHPKVLLVTGELDYNVLPIHSRLLTELFDRNGISYMFQSFPFEFHGLSIQNNIYIFEDMVLEILNSASISAI